MEMEQTDKDALLTQFLGMTEDRVDPDVAMSLLEACNWDLQAAIEQLFGGPVSPNSRPGTAGMEADPVPIGDDLFTGAHNPPPIPQAPVAPVAPAAPGHFVDDAHIDAEEEMIRQAMALSREESGGGAAVVPPMVDFPHPPPGAASPQASPGLPRAPQGAEGPDDPQLAAAIHASYTAQTSAGRNQSEDELMQQAMDISRKEEESRQRQSLREQQEAELLESMLMDQGREEEERRQREEQARLQAATEESRRQQEQQERDKESRASAELEAKRARLDSITEPLTGEAGRLSLMIKLPNGSRLQRAFRPTENVGLIYDFVDVQQLPELKGQNYRLVSTMPRKAYEDRIQTLPDAGIQHQFVLMVEVIA